MITATIETANITDTEALTLLQDANAEDYDSIAYKLLKHPNISAELIDELTFGLDCDGAEFIAARHPNTGATTICGIIENCSGQVGGLREETGIEMLELLAQHPNASRDNLELIRSVLAHAYDEEAAAGVLYLVEQHPNA